MWFAVRYPHNRPGPKIMLLTRSQEGTKFPRRRILGDFDQSCYAHAG